MPDERQTPTMLGYGEDALTLWVFTNQTQEFLRQVDDDTSVKDTRVHFRPSFGRGGRPADPKSKVRAEFGEFDAIVLTRQAVYLVESKWHRSGELSEDSIDLKGVQVRRHRIFREYLEQWRSRRPIDWGEFASALEPIFANTDLDVRPAPEGSVLAVNLKFVLEECSEAIVPVRDVLLLLAPTGWSRSLEPPRGFDLVQIEYEPVGESQFVQIA